MLKKILFIVLVVCSYNAMGQTKDAKSILDLLAQQEKAWNLGDINEFMKGYWESDSLVFVGKNGLTYGFKNTLANYKKIIQTKLIWGS